MSALNKTLKSNGTVDFTPDPALYPFKSRWFDSSVGPVHYIDEGQGQTLFLMHGNPDWSFLYRKMIPILSADFRCIAPDLPGFGLSAHPEGYSYMPEEHANIMGELVDHLDLTDMIVMGQDWGGPISIDMASRRPARVSGLVYGNTNFWPPDARMPTLFSKLMGTRLFQWLIKEKNILPGFILKSMLQAPISKAEHAHYKDVFPTPESRLGPALFPIAILSAEPWFKELEPRVRKELTDLPMLLLFGRKDPVLGDKATSDRWLEAFPHATMLELPDAGHFFQHDDPEQTSKAIIEKYAR